MQIRPSARRALCAAATVSLAAASVARAADVESSWSGAAAAWENAANWSNTPSVAQFPNNGNGGLTYDVVVGSGTVSQAGAITIEALTLNAGTINTGGANLNLNQAFTWAGGGLSGGGNVLANAGININVGTSKTLNATLTNAGFANWAASGISGTGTINNQANAVFNVQTVSGTPVLNLAQFNNAGTIMKIIPTNNAFGGTMTFNNTGTLEAAAGTFNINGPVTQLSGSTLTGGTWNVGGTLLMPLGSPITTLGSGASVRLFGGAAAFTKIDGLTLNQGTFGVGNGQAFTTAGAFSNTGTLNVESSSTFTVTTSLAQQSGDTLTAGTYVVGGTLVLPGGDIVTNQANFTLDGAGSVCTNINALADNQGTFRLIHGRTFSAAAAFNNSGAVHVGPPSDTAVPSVLTLGFGGTHTGSFVVDAGSAITLTGGTHTFNATAAFSGGGTLNINNAATTVTCNANLTAPTTTNFNGGTIGGSGSLSIPAGATFRFSSSTAKTLSGTIDNAGTAMWMGSSGVFGSGTFNNLPGATFQILAGSTTAFGISQFNNAGTVNKTTAGPANNFGGATTFNNTGTVNVNAGTLNVNGVVPQVSGATLTGGTWKVANATLVLTNGSNLATIAPAAAVSLSGASSVFTKIDTLADNQGAFTITNSRNFTTVGDLANSGTITVGPGSTLTVTGAFTNTGTVTGDGILGSGAVAAGSYGMQSGAVDVSLGGAAALTKTTAGTATLTGNNNYTGGTNVSAGTLEVNKMHAGNAVTITGGTLRVLESTPGLASGHPAGDDAFVSQPSSLNVAAGATLDLTNNDVILDYTGASPVATYEALVASGYNVTGDWQGDGITSSVAALDGNYVVAIADNADLAAPFGSAQGGPLFAGVDVDLDAILIKFTHRADINLDGLVTPDDSAVFGGNYDENEPAVWATGDMNYDGIFTPDDAAFFGGAYDESLNSLPEPGMLCIWSGLGLVLGRRARSRAG